MKSAYAEGDVLAGRYRLEGVIGAGAMGRVHRAFDAQEHRVVAIKILGSAMAEHSMRTRFTREAKAMASLASEHVVRVLDFGIAPPDVPFMVLEYLEGSDLREVINTRGALAAWQAADYVLMACDGLAEAHLAGVVHRDLKPQNLFLTRRPDGMPCVKVLDFGVSKTAVTDSTSLTGSYVMLGSPAFVSPEQMRDARSVDARSDVWSLGVVLYMLLSGEKPFGGDDVAATCAAIAADPPVPLRGRGLNVPEALEAIVMRCLEKKRELRTPNVAALARDLAPFASPAVRPLADRIVAAFVGRGLSLDRAPAPSAPPRALDDLVTEVTAPPEPKPILPMARRQAAPVYRPRPTKPPGKS